MGNIIEYGDVKASDIVNGTYIIDKSVKVIGKGAFHNLKSLREIVIPDGVVICDGAFMGSGLKRVVIGNCKVIPNDAFVDCTELQEVIISSGVEVIGSNAFAYCARLESIRIPNSVDLIGMGAFYGCYNLTSVHMPSELKVISDFTFKDCWKLTNINIPYRLELIGIEAFRCCSSLKTVELPSSVRLLGDMSFSGAGLTSVEIPRGCELVGKPFEFCMSIA